MQAINQETGETYQVMNRARDVTDEPLEAQVARAWNAETPIAPFPKSISRFASDTQKPSHDDIRIQLNRLRQCKHLKSDGAWEILSGKIIDNQMSLGRFSCAVDFLISKHKGQTFNFPDLLDYDEQLPVYRISELNDRGDGSKLIGKTFCQIRYNGWRGVWIEKRHAEALGAKTYGETTVEAKERKTQDTRETDFLSMASNTDGHGNSQIFVERFNLRHKTDFASFRELYEWYRELPSDYIRDNRLDEPLFPENKNVSW